MSSRIFQSVVLQMKDCSDRAVGVIDEQGTVVACNELACIGEKWGGAAALLTAEQDSTVVSGGFTFKALPGWNNQFDYAAFVRGEDERAALICSMAVIALNGAKAGKKLTLNLGYSHPVEMEDPEGIESVVEGTNVIIVKGIDKEKVGQFAAEIRDKRRPEPYKGKGIKYADEVIRRKVGKTGKK